MWLKHALQTKSACSPGDQTDSKRDIFASVFLRPTIPRNFCELTGYNRDEILGRNCRFLQGPATDRVTVNKIRKAVDEKYPDSLCLVNYRKDGAPFWNNLYISPLFDQAHTVIHYIGVQCDVTAAYVPEGDANNAVSGSAMPSAAIPVAWRT